MDGKETDIFGNTRASIPQEDPCFSDLYENLDTCPECDSGPLVLRNRGWVCPDRACRALVIPT